MSASRSMFADRVADDRHPLRRAVPKPSAAILLESTVANTETFSASDIVLIVHDALRKASVLLLIVNAVIAITADASSSLKLRFLFTAQYDKRITAAVVIRVEMNPVESWSARSIEVIIASQILLAI